jgi:prevent-host-death family protein
MKENFTLTEAKARLSEIINRLIYHKSNIMITKKGKRVAVIMPFETYQNIEKGQNRGLILAYKSLEDNDKEVDEMCNLIYKEREREKSREVPL